MKLVDKKLCGRIVLLRQRLGLSQRAFGERIGRSANHLNRVENGKISPSPELLERISATFGVSEDWLQNGTGPLIVESVGDRFKAVRKKRDYTQEELAAELHISRNSVGMIERGMFRPSEEIIDLLCDRLWIDKNWLLTGVGNMERTELTPFYELLKRDPGVRQHIKSFIEHLERPVRRESTAEEKPEADRWITAYVVNDVQQARLFCSHYNIPYREEETEDGTKIQVKVPRDIDQERAHDLNQRLRRTRLSRLCDHEFVWRDADDNTLVTYSPYDVEEVRQTWIEKVEDNFYGHGSTTFIIQC